MRKSAPRGQLAVMAVAAVALTVFIPQAFRHRAADAQHHSASDYWGTPIPGLAAPPLITKARAALPSGRVSTDRYNDDGPSKSTFVDNSQSEDPEATGQISITYNPDHTVWMVSCNAETTDPAANVTLRFCTDLDYTGANPAAIRPWVQGFFAKKVIGSSLSQDRSAAHWIVSINKFSEDGPLTYRINIQSAISTG